MLKTKLHKAGFIFTSFMLMAAASGSRKVTVTAGPTEIIKPAISRDSVVVHAFDTTGLCTCLPELNAEEKENAPRIKPHILAQHFMKVHLEENGLYYEKIKTKNAPVLQLIDEVFAKYQLPLELKYLAVVESKLDNRIVSGAGAAGLWQFMPQAGRSFGLKILKNTDDRKNNYKSTVAAAKCLTYLHQQFGDWLLTLAAYNTGPAKILTAIKKAGSRDYWTIQRYLPAETRKHVLKFISVHYFFEGHGSLVTMSLAETNAHTKSVDEFLFSSSKLMPAIDSLQQGDAAGN